MTTILRWLDRHFRLLRVVTVAGVAVGLVLLGLWFRLDSDEWASWVQAVGSIAAIFIAFEIVNRQHRNDRALEDSKREDENQGELDDKLLGRTLAVQNVVQVCSHSLHAALSLLTILKGSQARWEADQHGSQIEKLGLVLDSLITPTTDPLAVIAALEISLVLTQTRADFQHIGGAMTNTLLARSEARIGQGYDFLDRLIALQRKLTDQCAARGLPLEISDLAHYR